MFQVIGSAEIVDQDVRLVVARPALENQVLRMGHYVGDHGLEANKFRSPRLHCRDITSADVFGDQDGEAQFSARHDPVFRLSIGVRSRRQSAR